MGRYLVAWLLLLPVMAVGQLTEGSPQTWSVTSAGTLYGRVAVGFGAAASNRKVVVYNGSGAGITDAAGLYGQYPMKLHNDGWDFKRALSPGDTVYYAFFSAVSAQNTCDGYARHTNYIFQTLLAPADTVAIHAANRFIRTGYSEGGANLSLAWTNFCFSGLSVLDVRYRFRRFITVGTGTWQNINLLDELGDEIGYWGFHDPGDGTTSVTNTRDVYNSFSAHASADLFRVKKTEVSGPGHSGIDDYAWTLTGTNANDDIFLWMYDPYYNLVTSFTKIEIKPIDVKEVIGGGNPIRFFDEGLDPMNGEDDIPVTTAIPGDRKYYFEHDEANEDTLFWIDVDLRGLHHIDRVSLGVNNSFFDDSVIVFFGYYDPDNINLNGIFRRVAATWIDDGTNGWVHLDIDDTTAIVRIGIMGNYDNTTYFTSTAADVREIVIYGTEEEERAPPPPDTFTGTYPGYRTFNQQSGVNDNQGYTNWLYKKHYKNIRRGDQFDWNMPTLTDTIDHDPFDAASLGFKYTRRGYLDSAVNKLGLISYEMVHKIPYWLSVQGEPAEGYYYNLVTDNIFYASSYTRMGYFFWQRAAMDGFTPQDVAYLKVRNVTPYTADSTTFMMENQNEIEGTWRGSQNCVGCTFRYWSNTQYNAYSQVTWDGHEGRYGPRMGMYVADPHHQLISAATADLNWRYTNARVWLSRKTRTDGANIYAIEAQHQYLSNDIDQGLHPMYDSIRDEWREHIDYIKRIDSNLRSTINEYGSDASFGSILGVPDSVATERQKQANVLLWYQVMLSQTHFEWGNKYTFTFNADDANDGLFQTSGEYKSYIGEPVEHPEAANWVGRQFYALMGNYQYDSSYAAETYGWNMYNRYRYWRDGTDSLIYLVGKPNNEGDSDNVTLTVGSGKRAWVYTWSYTSLTPTVEELTVTGGDVTVTVNDLIKAVVVVPEDGASPTPRTILRNRGKTNTD